jgi:hypothetical protein
MGQFGFLDVLLFTSYLREDTEVNLTFCQSAKDPEFGTMLALKFPSHATHILGGNRN